MDNEQPLEHCREWIEETVNHCGQPAIAIVWGKLFPSPALGPKCLDHLGKYVDPYRFEQWAVFDLRGLKRS